LSRNKNRVEGHQPKQTQGTAALSPLNFVAPTEFVDLPSGGEGYPDDHPLLNEETIEIRFMTAKDEDILTSQALLKNGIALERFLENILIDKSINPETLLIGDKNAILIAARASGYGFDYETHVLCPDCGTKNDIIFDLRDPKTIGKSQVDDTIVKKVKNGIYSTQMPFTKFTTHFRLMNGGDENFIAKQLTNDSETTSQNVLTGQFKRIITSIEGHTDQAVIDQFVENMPTIDSRHFKICLRAVTPNIDIKENLICTNCKFEKEVEVPFGTDFFWPDL